MRFLHEFIVRQIRKTLRTHKTEFDLSVKFATFVSQKPSIFFSSVSILATSKHVQHHHSLQPHKSLCEAVFSPLKERCEHWKVNSLTKKRQSSNYHRGE